LYTEPQTITISTVAQTLVRTGLGLNSGIFTKDDGTVKLSISHALTNGGKRNRRVARIDHSKIAADPLAPALNAQSKMAFYVVADVPVNGYSIAEQKAIVDAFLAWASASSGSAITKLLGGES
jgi:hypothetical protein